MFGFLPNIFFEGEKRCMWVEGLHASDLDQPPFADKEPEAQSF